MHRDSGTRPLDKVDRQLCTMLLADPRSSNRALAESIGMTDETVASRLRMLRDDGILATTVVVDWRKAGYGVQVVATVRMQGRSFIEAVKPLFDDEQVFAMVEVSGPCDGVITFFAPDARHAHRFVIESLRDLDGVVDVQVSLVVEDLKAATTLTLPIPDWDPSELPKPFVPMDDVDHQLVRELTRDGHESYSELGRRLGVSDATIRRRVQRLEESGLLKVVGAVDPVATGDVTSVAYAFVEIGGQLDQLKRRLSHLPIVLKASACLGSSDVVMLLGASEDNLTRFASRELGSLPGVVSSRIAFANETLYHRSHLVSLQTGSPRKD